MAYEPLIRDSDGSGNVALRKASTTEENYLAYRLGLYLADSANIANALITTSSTNGTDIGSFSNTYYNAVLGQHGFEFTDITTETTTLYQKNSVLNETDSDCYRPLEHSIDDGQTRIDEFDSGDLDGLTNRLISRVFTSDYPGTIKLATSSPSGDYTYIQEAFRDTRANDDSDVNIYNLYKRTSMTAPDTIQPFRIKRHNDSDAGFYQGLQLMTDRQIEQTFGARARHLISSSASTVGSYQLRTAVQGAPTDAGTWVAQGVAVDTRNTAIEKDFTRNSQSTASENFINERSSTYTGAFEGTFTSNVNFVSDFLRDFTGNFVGNFVGPGTDGGSGDFLGNFAQLFTGDFLRDFLGDFTGDFVGNYTEDLNYTDTFQGGFARDFTGNFTADFLGQPPQFEAVYIRNWQGNYAGPTGTYVGDYVFGPTITGDFAYGAEGGFIGDYVGDDNLNFQYDGSSYYWYETASGIQLVYNGVNLGTYSYGVVFTSGSTGRSTIFATDGNFYARDDNVASGNPGGTLYAVALAPNDGTTEYAGTNYTRNSTTAYQNNFIGDFVNEDAGASYAGDFTTDTFVGVYTDDTHIEGYNTNFIGDFVGEGDYQNEFTRNSTANFIGDFISAQNFTGNIEEPFTNEDAFIGDFTGAFLGDFTGNYLGFELTDTVNTINTYTLYVRVA